MTDKKNEVWDEVPNSATPRVEPKDNSKHQCDKNG